MLLEPVVRLQRYLGETSAQVQASSVSRCRSAVNIRVPHYLLPWCLVLGDWLHNCRTAVGRVPLQAAQAPRHLHSKSLPRPHHSEPGVWKGWKEGPVQGCPFSPIPKCTIANPTYPSVARDFPNLYLLCIRFLLVCAVVTVFCFFALCLYFAQQP
jgi:hypothetical protein